MRVAIDALLLSRRFSGVESAILNLGRGLRESGRHDYTFFVPDRFPGCPADTARFAVCAVGGRCHYRPVRLLYEQLVLPRVTARGAFDLLHAPGYLAPLRATVPTVVTVYDLTALLRPQFCSRLNRINYRFFLPRSIRMAAGILVPSKRVRSELLERFPGVEARTGLVPLCVGPEFRVVDAGTVEAVADRYGLRGPCVLFVGNREPKKNLPGLLEAFRLLKVTHGIEHQLVLVGAEGWGGTDVAAHVRRLGLGESVVCTGYVPQPDLVALYNAADVFLFPSLYEGFGLPPLEAMACRTPVVCSSAGALDETVGDAALRASEDDPAALAEATARVLADAELRRDCIEKGRFRAGKFSMKAMAAAVDDFYEATLVRVQAGRDGTGLSSSSPGVGE